VNRGVPTAVLLHVHHGGHRFLWLLLLILFLALVVLAVSRLLRLTRSGGSGAAGGAPADAAVESVRLRYARGEIDRDEFVRVSSDLGVPPPAPAT
jgi:putative membrane protein